MTACSIPKEVGSHTLVPHPQQPLIEMTIPEKPGSRLQKYRLTTKGKALPREEEQQTMSDE